MKRLLTIVGCTVVGLSGVVMSDAWAASRSKVNCSVDSGKAFSPALTPTEICDRFKRSLGAKAGTVRVELRFSLTGVASAKASQLRQGQWKAFPLFEMAVMGRRFNKSDIDRLANDVVRGIAAPPKAGGK
jgi:hypothetical protein